jgi:hypothetical protein
VELHTAGQAPLTEDFGRRVAEGLQRRLGDVGFSSAERGALEVRAARSLDQQPVSGVNSELGACLWLASVSFAEGQLSLELRLFTAHVPFWERATRKTGDLLWQRLSRAPLDGELRHHLRASGVRFQVLGAPSLAPLLAAGVPVRLAGAPLGVTVHDADGDDLPDVAVLSRRAVASVATTSGRVSWLSLRGLSTKQDPSRNPTGRVWPLHAPPLGQLGIWTSDLDFVYAGQQTALPLSPEMFGCPPPARPVAQGLLGASPVCAAPEPGTDVFRLQSPPAFLGGADALVVAVATAHLFDPSQARWVGWGAAVSPRGHLSVWDSTGRLHTTQTQVGTAIALIDPFGTGEPWVVFSDGDPEAAQDRLQVRRVSAPADSPPLFVGELPPVAAVGSADVDLDGDVELIVLVEAPAENTELWLLDFGATAWTSAAHAAGTPMLPVWAP